MSNTGYDIIQALQVTDNQYIVDQTGMVEPSSNLTSRTEGIAVTGLFSIITNARDEEKLLAISTKPQGRCGHFVVDAAHKSSLTKYWKYLNFRRYSTNQSDIEQAHGRSLFTITWITFSPGHLTAHSDF